MAQDDTSAEADRDGQAQMQIPGARALTPQAQRALAEAQERRAATMSAATPKEVGGRNGPDPVRYGDWEKGGIVSDF